VGPYHAISHHSSTDRRCIELNIGGRLGKRLEAAIFDWDGVILDNLAAAVESYNHILETYGLDKVDTEQLRNMDNANWYHFYREKGLPKEYWDEADRLWVQKYSGLAKNLFPDVKTILERLKKTGIKLGLASNGTRKRVSREISNYGIDGFFDGYAFGDEVAMRKPAPDAINLVLDSLGVRADLTIYTGDTCEDILAARAAGVIPVALSRGFSSKDRLLTRRPDFIFQDLLSMVDELFG